MSTNYLQELDFQQLRVFSAVYEEGSATRAALRLGVTQPAVSHALARLRHVLQDELFVRTPRGLTPTNRADRLASPLRTALERLEGVLAEHMDDRVDLKDVDRIFRTSMSDYAAALILPPLVEQLKRDAPQLRMSALNYGAQTLDDLEDGRVDLVVGTFPSAPESFRQQTLLSEQMVCLLRRDHPAAREELTLTRYLELRHLVVNPKGRPTTSIDEHLSTLGHRRDNVLVVTSLVAPFVVAETDLVLTTGARLAKRLADTMAVVIRPCPFDVGGFRLTQLWHSRAQDDPVHRALRVRVAGCLADDANS